MQRIAPNAMPPRSGNGSRPGSGNMGAGEESPAFRMASRIRAEQGAERAAQYLGAMEPFLAPAERAHIAERLGLRLPEPPPAYQPPPPSFQAPQAAPNPGNTGGLGSMGGLGNMGGLGSMGGLGNIAGMLGGMNGGNMGPLGNIGGLMQMMQMMQGLTGGGKNAGLGNGGPGLGNPMQLAQMLGGLMGGNRNQKPL